MRKNQNMMNDVAPAGLRAKPMIISYDVRNIVITRLGQEMDPVLLEILMDRVTKYLTGTRQTKYIVGNKEKRKPDY